MMRQFCFAAALLALAACGPAPAPAPAPVEDGPVVYDALASNPHDWIFILRTSDGGEIKFNQRTVTRANGMADIWLQVHHGREQVMGMETETTEAVVRYQLERLHYRFNCAEESFIIVERQIMGANEQVVTREQPTQDWRPTQAGGAAIYVLPMACRGT